MGIGPLWRITRTRGARRLYEWLDSLGITATRMLVYARQSHPADRHGLPKGFETRYCDGVTAESWADLDRTLRSDDLVVAALADRAVIARLVISTRPVSVDPLDATVDRAGGYVWRVFVDPAYRNRGIGTGLLAEAVWIAAERGIEDLYSLVAADNMPSRWAFEAAGFERVGTASRLKIFGFERRDAGAARGEGTETPDRD